MVIDLSTVDPRERPVLVLETIGGKIIAPLMTAVDIKLELNYNEASKLSFKISQLVDGIATPGYDQIASMNVIDVQGYGRFILVKPSVTADGVTEIKSCSAYSLEYEMSYKNITVANGTYRLWDELDSSGTLLGMICQKMTSWTVDSVDPILLTRYRTMEASNTRIYDFIKNTIQESFGCIFDFDTYNRTIRVVSVDTPVDTQPIYLSTDNLLKEIEIKEDDDDVVTCLTVSGAESVDIRSVNPMGTSSLYNLDHYMTTEHFDQDMIDKWAEWKATYEAAREEYYQNTIELYLTVARISTEQAKLATLKGEMVALENVQAVYIEGISTNLRTQEQLDAKNAEVAAKQSEINSQEDLIAELQNDLTEQTNALKAINQQTAFSAFFTAEEIKLLERYVIEGSFEDSTFVAPETASYTNKDIGAHLANTSLSVTGSDMSVIESAGGKTIYSFKGGKVTLGTFSAEIVRSVCDIADDGASVFTAYLASGTTDGTEGGSFTSGCISVVGTAGDIQSDDGSFAVVISEGDSYFTKNTTEFDKQAVEWDLYDYAAAVLARKSEPSYSFTVDCCNFLVREDFESFKNQLRLGKRCYLDIPHAGVKTPYVVSVTIEFDDPDDFSIEFGSNYSSSNDRFDLADLLEDSISVGKTVSLNTQNYSAFTESGAASTVQAYMTSALDLAKQAVQSSGEQAISWDDAGIRLRRWNDASHTSYNGKEIWMVNNNILFTTDNWQTAKMAIGELYDANLVSDENPDGTVYGIVAPYIVGTMLAGQNLMIDTEDGSFCVGKDGCRLYNANFDIESEHAATNTKGILSLHPDYGFLAGMVNQDDSVFTYDESGKITGVRTWKDDSELGVAKITDIADGYNLASNFWIDMYGDVYMKGTVYATDGSFTGILDIGGGNFYVDSAGNVTMKGNINMSSGAITWGANNSPVKVLYAKTLLQTPDQPYGEYSSSSETQWHTALSEDDLYSAYSYDGGETWTEALKISASDGENGRGIVSVTEYYASSDSSSDTPDSWGTSIPALDSTNRYLWNYRKVSYTDGTSYDSPKCVIKEHIPSYIQETYIDATEIRTPTIKTNLLTIQSTENAPVVDSNGAYHAFVGGLLLQGYFKGGILIGHEEDGYYDMLQIKYSYYESPPMVSIDSPSHAAIRLGGITDISVPKMIPLEEPDSLSSYLNITGNVLFTGFPSGEYGVNYKTSACLTANEAGGELYLYNSATYASAFIGQWPAPVSLCVNTSSCGELRLCKDGNATQAALLRSTNDGRGNLQLFNPSGKMGINIYTLTDNTCNGEIDVLNASGVSRASLLVTTGGYGALTLSTSSGTQYILTPELIKKLIDL